MKPTTLANIRVALADWALTDGTSIYQQVIEPGDPGLHMAVGDVVAFDAAYKILQRVWTYKLLESGWVSVLTYTVVDVAVDLKNIAVDVRMGDTALAVPLPLTEEEEH